MPRVRVDPNRWQPPVVATAILVLVLGAAPAWDSPPAAAAARVLPADRQAVLDSLLVLNRTAGAQAVADLVQAHLPAARAEADSFFVMRLVGIRGGSHASYGQWSRSLDDLAESRDLARALGDSFSVARALVWLAHGFELQGDQTASAAAYDQLAVVGRHLASPFFEGRGLIGQAWNRRQAGRQAEAESLYVHGGELARAAGDTFAALWSDNGLGLCLWDRGQLARADSLFQSVRRQSRQAGQRLVEAAALNNHAGLMEVLGRPDLALRGYLASRDLQLEDGNLREAIPAALNVAICQLQLGQLDAALETLAAVLADCRRAGFRDFEAASLANLARVHLARERPALAAATSRQALADRRPLQPRHEIQLLLTLARALASQDSLVIASRTAAEAAGLAANLGEVHLQIDAALLHGELLLRDGEPQAAVQVFGAALGPAAEAGLVALQLALLSQTGRAYWQSGETAQARHHLLEALHFWENTRSLPTDPDWRERRGGSARRLFETLAALTLAEPDDEPVDRRQQRCFDLLQHYKARTLLERSLGPGRQLDPPPPVTLARLQSETLRPGEVLADLYIGEDQSLLFAVTRDTLAVQVLQGRQQVQQMMAIADGLLLTAPDQASLAPLHHLLGSLCTPGLAEPDGRPDAAPLRLLASARSLIWSPAGPLHRLPVAALLPDPDLTVTHVPSATFLANLRTAAADQPLPDPAVTAGQTVRILAAAGRSDLTGRPLAGALAEVQWLRREFAGVELLVDELLADELLVDELLVDELLADELLAGATGSVLEAIDQAAPFAILHVAAHAELDVQRPWNSALMLGDAEQPRWLRAGDLAGAPWPVQLAVLTSCSSGDGAVLPGEGMLGLTAGCLAAGIPAVLATLWPVADHDALHFSRRFYTELSRGHSVTVALHRTQQWLRAQPGTGRPHQWAAYVLWGDGDLTFDLQRRSRWAPRWLPPEHRPAARTAALAVLATLAGLGVVHVRRTAQRKRVQCREMDLPSASRRKR